ncbi:hypothetical protein [Myxosarcina sp. GI1]|uniref:hypothetical protein n=1 Tax=Myxosarcina sp. GI1 TaxID=1541065 RepID=UPI00056CA59F|nr:hypothetical protein [Myxosarcina sp. GI1]
MDSLPNSTSASFEKAALAKFRSLADCLPQDSKIFREPWGRSTVLCIDFESCPQFFPIDRQQTELLAQALAKLGLANSIIFRDGSKIMGWKKM